MAIELWSGTDGFFYDALCYPDGSYHKFRVRSLVGLIPLYAIERLEENWITPFTEFRANLHWFLKNRQDLVQRCVTTVENDSGTVHVLALINPEQMCRLLQRVWDPAEFRSEYGLRSLSKYHAAASLCVWRTRRALQPRGGGREAKGRQFQLARPGVVSYHLLDD